MMDNVKHEDCKEVLFVSEARSLRERELNTVLIISFVCLYSWIIVIGFSTG
jgi:hypothetical protein